MSDIVVDDATSLDAPAILSLLERCRLPTAGLADHLAETLVARRDGQIVGSAALELYADGALLRSVAADPRERGVGLGHALVLGWVWSVLAAYSVGEWMPRAIESYYLQRPIVGWLFFLGISTVMVAPYHTAFALCGATQVDH